jgi:hypothetical protein
LDFTLYWSVSPGPLMRSLELFDALLCSPSLRLFLRKSYLEVKGVVEEVVAKLRSVAKNSGSAKGGHVSHRDI